MQPLPSRLSQSEINALQALVHAGGSMLETKIPERNERTVFGDVTPGLRVYRQLEKQGLLFFTEKEPMDWPGHPMDGFVFTPEVYITDEGRARLSAVL